LGTICFLDTFRGQHYGPVIPKGHEIGMTLLNIKGGRGQRPFGQDEQTFEPGSHQLGDNLAKQPPPVGSCKGHRQSTRGPGQSEQFFRSHFFRGIDFINGNIPGAMPQVR